MYERFYGLRELPFSLTSNPRYLFLTPRHREVLSNLQYGISARKGITLLIGEAGTGKTTLIRAALDSDQLKPAQCVYLNNPTLTRQEFVEFLATAFSLGPEATTSKVALLSELERGLLEKGEKQQVAALIIDEAQSLSDELLEEIRLLSNIETDAHKLLPVVLAGQPELADRLNEAGLRQLKQRVALRCDLRPLDLHETAAYIAGRIRIAGGDAIQLFTREAVKTIYERARGIPRTISVICDNALVSGLASDRRPVGQDIVLEVCRDFDFEAPDLPQAGEPWVQSPDNGHPPAATEPKLNETGEVADANAAGLFSSLRRRRRFSFF